MNTTPAPWHWHDRFGRKQGTGDVPTCGTTDVPTGQANRFSFAVSDAQGFVVARCANALVTMDSERSEANARLIAAAPELLAACLAARKAMNALGIVGDPAQFELDAAIAKAASK